MSHNQPMFDPNNLPEVPTAIYDVTGVRIGTFNPHTLMIHPMGNSNYGPMKLLGHLAFDAANNLVGRFTDSGLFSANDISEEQASA